MTEAETEAETADVIAGGYITQTSDPSGQFTDGDQEANLANTGSQISAHHTTTDVRFGEELLAQKRKLEAQQLELEQLESELVELDKQDTQLASLLELLDDEILLRTRQQQRERELILLTTQKEGLAQSSGGATATLRSLLEDGLSRVEWEEVGSYFCDRLRAIGGAGLRRYSAGVHLC